MAISAWSEAIPSGISAIGTFPRYARQTFAAISAGLAVEHFWNSSGGGSDASAGDLLPGASRAFVAAQSASSFPPDGVGRAFLASNVSRLFLYDSSGTYLGGSAFFSEHATPVSTAYWARCTGSYTTTGTSGVTTITFPIPFAGTPRVYQSVDTTIYVVAVGTVSPSAFSSLFSVVAGLNTLTVLWEAIGTVSGLSY